jgi:hypothetical protein
MVFNFSFVPFVYFLFPETAGRTLEDIDHYFRTHNKPKDILVFRDKVATSSKRPLEYIEKEEAQVRRQSSVDPRAASLAAQHNRSRRTSANADPEGGRGGVFTEKEDVIAHKEMK